MRTLLVLSAVLLATSFVHASITGINCQDDGDGGIVMNSVTFEDNLTYDNALDEYTMSMSGDQFFSPAHVEGDVVATSLTKLWIIEDVGNYTNFSWTGYEIYIGMDKEFTISTAIAPDGWDYTINAPVSGQSLPSHTNPGTGWVGSIIFTATNPSFAIAPFESADFGAKVSFTGNVAFCTEQIPTPEPATMAILGLGSMALLRGRKTA